MALTQVGIDNEINALLASGSDIPASTLRQVLHDMNASVFQSAVIGLANPLAVIGLAAVNGSSFNAMRADAAPPISQSIVPSWTGQHNFKAGLNAGFPGGIAGFLTLNGNVSGSNTLTVTSNGATFQVSGSLQIGGGLSVNGTSGVVVQAGQRVTGSCSGTVATSDYPVSVVSGATMLVVRVITTTAFLASGSVNLTAGTAVGDNAYITATNIKALGAVTLTFSGSLTAAAAANLASMPAGQPNFFIRLTQTGTPSGVGSANIAVEYLVVP